MLGFNHPAIAGWQLPVRSVAFVSAHNQPLVLKRPNVPLCMSMMWQQDAASLISEEVDLPEYDGSYFSGVPGGVIIYVVLLLAWIYLPKLMSMPTLDKVLFLLKWQVGEALQKSLQIDQAKVMEMQKNLSRARSERMGIFRNKVEVPSDIGDKEEVDYDQARARLEKLFGKGPTP
mmetsp:Transcript_57422/g.84244  ORF Transcript_57422/g.84244 Transcript_57422/m.84244 type:complete len:175 (+) Transcript_57422:90-614(+)